MPWTFQILTNQGPFCWDFKRYTSTCVYTMTDIFTCFLINTVITFYFFSYTDSELDLYQEFK